MKNHYICLNNNSEHPVKAKPNNPNHMKNLKPFKKGADNRRNMNGAPKKLPSLDVLLANVLGKENKDGITEAELILMAMAKEALSGNVRATQLLLDRGYGSVLQQIKHSGKVATGGKVTIERKIVKKGE